MGWPKRFLLCAAAGSWQLAGGCEVAEEILETIRLALGIVDVWT